MRAGPLVRHSLAPLGVLAVLAGVAGAQAGQGKSPSVIALVPAANWHETGSEKLGADAAATWGGDPAVESEFGVRSIEHRTYQLENKPAGSVQCDVLIEEAADPSAAYGLLTYYHTESMAHDAATPLVQTGPEGGVAVRGPVFLRFVAPAAVRLSSNDVRALVILVAGLRTPSEATAGLPDPLLPPAGLVAGSDRYVLGTEVARRLLPGFPVETIGFAQGAEAQIGSYSAEPGPGAKAANAKRRSTLVAISYPTFQIARERYGQLEKALSLNQERGAVSVYGKRGGSFVFLVLNGESKAAASRLLDQLKVEEEVSWNQRYQSEKSVVLQMLEIIVSNLLLVCILAGMAVTGGLLIFLSKRVVHKWFPAAEWGSSEGERLIRLNLR